MREKYFLVLVSVWLINSTKIKNLLRTQSQYYYKSTMFVIKFCTRVIYIPTVYRIFVNNFLKRILKIKRQEMVRSEEIWDKLKRSKQGSDSNKKMEEDWTHIEKSRETAQQARFWHRALSGSGNREGHRIQGESPQWMFQKHRGHWLIDI